MRFSANDTMARLCGRTLEHNGARYLSYSGASVTFRFAGKSAKACIKSDPQSWPETLRCYLAVHVNGAKEPVRRFRLDAQEEVYTLYESDTEADVTLTLIKYTEAAFGLCGIVYLETDTEVLLPLSAASSRRMEIIGDSITCGYGVEAKDGTIPFSTDTENPTMSYSLLTAAMLGAQAQLLSWSGNGIISKYVPEDAEKPLDDELMPVLYPYTDLSLSKRLFGEDAARWEKWDFSRFEPDIILINLGTNDCSWCKDVAERKAHFQQEYGKFLGDVRAYNPHAVMLCMLGTMDQRVLKEVEEAVAAFKLAREDSAVHFLALPPQNAQDGYGADWHPSPKTQRMTAEMVSREAKKLMGWD